MALVELRNSPDYRYTLNALKGMARKCKISIKLLMSVLQDFNLFELTEVNGLTVVSSPYLDEAMGTYEEKCRKLSEASAKGFNKADRSADGRFTAKGGVLNKIKLNKTTTTVVTGTAPVTDVDDGDVDDADVDVAGIEPNAISIRPERNKHPGRIP